MVDQSFYYLLVSWLTGFIVVFMILDGTRRRIPGSLTILDTILWSVLWFITVPLLCFIYKGPQE